MACSFASGSIYTNCSDDNNCTAEDWLFVIKLGVLAATLLTIFFVFTQCTRFAVHFSFCINTSGVCARCAPAPAVIGCLCVHKRRTGNMDKGGR